MGAGDVMWEVKGLEVLNTSSNQNKIIMPIKLTIENKIN